MQGVETIGESFYITGGTLPPDASSYVHRQADSELLQSLLRGEFCYVLNTRQVGKSSLMIRTAGLLREAGREVAVVDLTAIGQNLTVEQWYYGILGRIGKQLGCYRELTGFWQAQRGLGPMQRWMEAVRQVVLPGLEPPSDPERASGLVVFIDEIDAVRALGFSADELFAGIRECYNRRAQDPVYRRLTFCLLGVATPADLIRETRMSPFNIGRRIEIRDFTATEAAPLARGLASAGLASPAPQRILSRILNWTSGHPYMTQRLCRAVAELPAEERGMAEQDAAALVDPLCRSLFLSRRAQETDDNLVFVRNRLLQSEVDLAGLLDLYMRVRAGRGVKDDETNPYCSVLRLSGVVRAEKGELRLRNRIYDHVFDQDWVLTHMPGAELRRQRAAYRKGQIRTAAIASAALLVVGTLAALAVAGENRARTAERKALAQQRKVTDLLSRSHVANGIRLMDADNLPGALLPLAEALRLDESDPARAAMDRARIAAALQGVSVPERVWFSGAPVRWAAYSPDGARVVTASEDGIAQVWDAATGERASPPWKHPGPVTFAAFSPDGGRVVTCSGDNAARIWRVGDETPLQVLHHPAPVVHAAWSPKGDRLATICFEQIAVWDAAASAPEGRQIASDRSPGARLTRIAYSPDGKRLVFTASNFLAWIVDADTLAGIAPLGTSRANRCYVGRSIAFDPAGNRVVVSGSFGDQSQETGACVFDARTGKPVFPALRHADFGTDARFSPNGRTIVTAGEDQTARVWSAATGKPVSPPLPHHANVVSAAFSPDARWIVTATGDEAAIWDAATGRRIGPPLRHGGRVALAAFDPSGTRVLTAGRDHTARVWPVVREPATARTLSNYATLIRQEYPHGGDYVLSVYGKVSPGSRVTDAAVELREAATGRLILSVPAAPQASGLWPGYTMSADGSRVALYGRAGVQVWNPATGTEPMPVLEGEWANFSEDGRKLLIRSHGGAVRILDVESGRETRLPTVRAVPAMDPWCRLLSPDGSRVVTRVSQSALAVCDSGTGQRLTPPMPHKGRVFLIRFSPDGRLLFTWAALQKIDVWDARTGRHLAEEPFVPGFAPSAIVGTQEGISFGPRGERALTGSSTVPSLQTPVGLWDLRTGEPVRNALRALPVATSPAFSPDGLRFATNGPEPRIWDSSTGAPLTPLLEHGGPVNSVAFSPDGRAVVTASADSTARVWNTATGAPLTPPLAHSKAVNSASFSADGRRIVTGAADGTLRIWDADTGEALTPMWKQTSPILHVRFTADGRHVIAAGEKETRVWDLPLEARPAAELVQLAELVSGQRLDPLVGLTNCEPDLLERCWTSVRSSAHPR